MPTVSLGALAARLDAELRGDPAVLISGVATPERSRPGDIAMLSDPGRRGLNASSASAFVVRKLLPEVQTPQLVCSDPARALCLLLELFGAFEPERLEGVDPRAAVEPSAAVAPTAWVGPFCYVGAEVVIGAGTQVEPFCYIGTGSRIGHDCRLGPGAVLARRSSLGDNVVIGPGAVIGYRGFGFWRDEDRWVPIPANAGVTIEDGVEIGANSCVDSGTLDDTRIGRGVKVDNLVQIGHNVTLGQRALLCAQVGLAGSVRVGEDCLLAGQVGVADHRQIGRNAQVGAHSGVAQDVPPEAQVSGYPAIDHRRWLRASVLFARLGGMARQLRALSDRVAELAMHGEK